MPDREWEASAHSPKRCSASGFRRGSGHKDDDTAGARAQEPVPRIVASCIRTTRQLSEARKELWHEAQEAYRCRDVDALRAIWPVARALKTSAFTRRWPPFGGDPARQDGHPRAPAGFGKLRNDRAWEYETRIKDPRFVVGIGWS